MSQSLKLKNSIRMKKDNPMKTTEYKEKMKQTSKGANNGMSKMWVLESPDGTRHVTEDLVGFCEKNGLAYGCMKSTPFEKNKTHRNGWKCCHFSKNESLLNSLSCVNIELTSFCSHKCWCCGRRKREKTEPSVIKTYGDMDFSLLKKIHKQIPENIIVQFHNNGDPLEYPYLKEALSLFKNNIRCFNTKSGKMLLEKQNEIIGNMEILTISNIPKDSMWRQEYKNLLKFLEYKKEDSPRVVIRLTGEIEQERVELYEEVAKKYNCLITKRILHSPMGSFDYEKEPTKPEVGICLDFLNHLSINKDGDVSICVRYDPEKAGLLGNIKNQVLEELWNSEKRKKWLNYHLTGQRNKIPLCSKCDFWGIPRGD